MGDLQQFAKVYNGDPQPQQVTSAPNGNYGYWVGQNVLLRCFQLTFAIITPALIIGGIAERMKYSALMIFIGCWMFVVYFPLAHCVWGIDGIHERRVERQGARLKPMDFAGGTVVHMSSGYSGFIARASSWVKRIRMGQNPLRAA